MHYKELKLSNVWRTCNKIRAAIFRVGLNLWDYYLPLDPQKNCVLSESKFVSVLAGPLRQTIGLSEQEITELADYFRIQDGRILYTQLCDVIHSSVPDFSKNANMVTGLEWEDPMHVNPLSTSELRRLNLLITKIAAVVNLRRLVLRPYFQDYELVAKNVGTVTLAHFARVLTFLGIILSDVDFQILVKRFLKDSYTINYVAFIHAVDQVIQYLDKHGILDLGGDIMDIFPGRIITAELPKLPRPEVGVTFMKEITGKQDNFHPSLNGPTQQDDLRIVLRRVQRHVLENSVRVKEFFVDFDPFHCGRITVNQFERGLDALGVGRIHRLYLSPPEVASLIIQYRDPIDPHRVCWKTFENDIDKVFTTQCLEKHPTLTVETPPIEVAELLRKGAGEWQKVSPATKDMCECVLEKIRTKAATRRIIIKPIFRDYDNANNGHVSRAQMRQCISRCGILLSEQENLALEQRFNDDIGFNYFWFLKELETTKVQPPLYEAYTAGLKRVNKVRGKKPVDRKDTDIVAILAKIKDKMVSERIRIIEFLQDYDKHKEYVINTDNFKRAFALSRFNLNENEIDTIIKVFHSPMRPNYVEYRRFAETLEEAFTQGCLERAPLIVPIQHLAVKDCEKTFLNFEERHTVAMAMQKLAKTPEFIINLHDVFEDFDKEKCGTVSTHQFQKVLSLRGLIHLISTHEFETLCKCFSFERGMHDEVDYRALCRALDLLYIASKSKPF